jgi:hypothetical protein
MKDNQSFPVNTENNKKNDRTLK